MKYIIAIVALFLLCFVNFADAETTLSWDANTEPDLKGYKVYRSAETGANYTMEAELGKVTTYTIPDELASCAFWVVTAFDFETLESDYSNEVSNCNGLPPSSPGALIINITNSNVNINVTP